MMSLPPHHWLVEISTLGQPDVRVFGAALSVVDRGGTKTIVLQTPSEIYDIVVLTPQDIRVFVPAGGIVPLYAHCAHGVVRLSNVASHLLPPDEPTTLDAYVFIQNLTGTPYPQCNIFKDIDLLRPSGVYRVKNGALLYSESLLEGGNPNGTVHDVLDVIEAKIGAQMAPGQPVAVLISGGFDSRLNLALAQHLAHKHGNRIYGFHEYKDEKEARIAKAVAAAADIDLVIKPRDFFLPKDRAVFLDDRLIDFQSGCYRENLMRWHAYLSWIREQIPGCLILGLGAEAHKGKFYGHVRDIDQDAGVVFGIDPSFVPAMARKMGIRRFNREAQTVFFDSLLAEATRFPDHASRVDYLHYQTYISNGYGKRGHDLMNEFGLPFPFLSNDFLKQVFALPRDKKEGFAIVRKGIHRFAPNLSDIPYTSANEKSILPRKISVRAHLRKTAISLLGPVYYDLFPPARKGRTAPTTEEILRIDQIAARSDFLGQLKDVFDSGFERIPFLQLDYLIQSLLYLDVVSRKTGSTFRLGSS